MTKVDCWNFKVSERFSKKNNYFAGFSDLFSSFEPFRLEGCAPGRGISSVGFTLRSAAKISSSGTTFFVFSIKNPSLC
jgi:hypothetical protein